MIKELLSGTISQTDILNYYNATISYEELPVGINGFVWQYNGIFNIFINKNLSYYKKRKAILHELAHIELNQLEQYDNDLFELKRDSYEDEADLYLKEIKRNLYI